MSILDHFLTDEEETWGNRNVVLQKYAGDFVLKENGNRSSLIFRIKKKQFKFYTIHTEERMLGESGTDRTY